MRSCGRTSTITRRLAAIYAVVAQGLREDRCTSTGRSSGRRTSWCRSTSTSSPIAAVTDFVAINAETIDLIKQKHGGDDTKVINLIKSIEKTAEEESGDPFLIAMADRAKAVQESYEDRQAATAEVLEELFKLVENNERRKREQAAKGFDGLTYFVYRTMLDAGLSNAEEISKKIKSAFVEHSGWRQSEKGLRELRKKVTFRDLFPRRRSQQGNRDGRRAFYLAEQGR